MSSFKMNTYREGRFRSSNRIFAYNIKKVFKKYYANALTGFKWMRMEMGCCEHGNECPASIKLRKRLGFVSKISAPRSFVS